MSAEIWFVACTDSRMDDGNVLEVSELLAVGFSRAGPPRIGRTVVQSAGMLGWVNTLMRHDHDLCVAEGGLRVVMCECRVLY